MFIEHEEQWRNSPHEIQMRDRKHRDNDLPEILGDKFFTNMFRFFKKQFTHSLSLILCRSLSKTLFNNFLNVNN